MVAQRGKDFLLKMDEAGGGTYTTVAGLRSRRLAISLTISLTGGSAHEGQSRRLGIRLGIRRPSGARYLCMW